MILFIKDPFQYNRIW